MIQTGKIDQLIVIGQLNEKCYQLVTTMANRQDLTNALARQLLNHNYTDRDQLLVSTIGQFSISDVLMMVDDLELEIVHSIYYDLCDQYSHETIDSPLTEKLVSMVNHRLSDNEIITLEIDQANPTRVNVNYNYREIFSLQQSVIEAEQGRTSLTELVISLADTQRCPLTQVVVATAERVLISEQRRTECINHAMNIITGSQPRVIDLFVDHVSQNLQNWRQAADPVETVVFAEYDLNDVIRQAQDQQLNNYLAEAINLSIDLIEFKRPQLLDKLQLNYARLAEWAQTQIMTELFHQLVAVKYRRRFLNLAGDRYMVQIDWWPTNQPDDPRFNSDCTLRYTIK